MTVHQTRAKVLAIDVSGGMGPQAIQAAIGLVDGPCLVIGFDVAITAEVEVEGPADLDPSDFRTGGGTNLIPVIARAAGIGGHVLLTVVTDGWFDTKAAAKAAAAVEGLELQFLILDPAAAESVTADFEAAMPGRVSVATLDANF